MSKKESEAAIQRIKEYQKSPFPFIKDMWGLIPQPIRPEFKSRVQIYIEDARYDEVLPIFFEEYQEGKHITYQQWMMLLSVERALDNKAKRRISVRSGHGIGKSCTMSWLLLWFLFCNHEAQIACTAPSRTQMKDVLWKEVKKWINKMPESIQEQYDHQSDYLRMTDAPEVWFARARTARKENPEALAGVHGPAVMLLCDEASGVPEEIFNTVEGALTEEHVFVIMISNPTRVTGYFYESHNMEEGGDGDAWEKFHFSTIDCPRVTAAYEERIIKKHGKDSDEYKIRVLGDFPSSEAVDDEGYVNLLSPDDIVEIDVPQTLTNTIWIGTPIMGVDPAGEGIDTTDWVIRDSFKARRVHTEKLSSDKSIAKKTIELAIRNGVKAEDIYVDSFGEGGKAAIELVKQGWHINAVHVGDQCEEDDDKELYMNIRAMIYSRLKRWTKTGGEYIKSEKWKKELSTIRERRSEGKSRIQIMSKQKMRKKGFRSPNTADAMALTFTEDIGAHRIPIKVITRIQQEAKRNNINSNNSDNSDNKFAPL